MTIMKRTLIATLAIVGVISACSANAAVIIQQSGSDDIRFEAGSYGSIVNGTSFVTDNSDGTLTTTTGGSDSLVTYQINFATAGNYFLYFDAMSGGASADSVWVNHAAGFNSVPGTNSSESWNSLSVGNNVAWNGLFNIGTGLSANTAYSVTAGSPAFAWNVASPGTVSFTVRSREAGLTWNGFVFSSSDTESVSDLNALPLSNVVPEPGSLALLGVGGLMLLTIHRR